MVELDIAHEVRRVSASRLAFDRSAQTLTFRPRGATPVGIAADEQTLRNWLQGALLSVDVAPSRAQPHERAIEVLLRKLQERHDRGHDPFADYRERPRAALTPSLHEPTVPVLVS
ncbi:hypothetical protein [Nocardioides salarius]|uniref:hypothetical protein n=1 Tax=Nocardioides salarius TaxID=374513 RepID=UPI0030FA1905